MPTFDAVLSTYAVHHLTGAEKVLLFQLIWERLWPGGRAVFGDLMFADEAERALLDRKYEQLGDQETLEGFVRNSSGW